MAKRKSSRVSLPSVTQPRGLLSTRRRTSKRPAIAKDLADDKRAGPAVFHDQGGHLARHASLVWARAPASRSLAEQGDLVRRGMRAAVLRRNHSGPFLIILAGHGLRFPQAFARRPARPRRTNRHSAEPAMPGPVTAFRDHRPREVQHRRSEPDFAILLSRQQIVESWAIMGNLGSIGARGQSNATVQITADHSPLSGGVPFCSLS